MSWMWSNGKVTWSSQYPFNLLSFHLTSIRPIIPEIQLFRNLTFKHPRPSHEWGQRSRWHIYPVTNRCTFSFHINRTNKSRDMAKIVFDPEKTHPNFLQKVCQNYSFQQNFQKSNQVISMTRAIKLQRFVVMTWVVLTSSCRQANFC